MRKRKGGVPRYEVSCARCGWTKEITQRQYDRHMLTVHKIKNEIKVGGPQVQAHFDLQKICA